MLKHLLSNMPRIARFALIGTISTITFLISQRILIGWAGLDLNLATNASFGVAFFTSYFGHHRMTFGLSGGHVNYMPRYIIATVVLIGLSNILVYYAVNVAGFSYMQASLFVAIFYPISSYLVQSIWVFIEKLPKLTASAPVPEDNVLPARQSAAPASSSGTVEEALTVSNGQR